MFSRYLSSKLLFTILLANILTACGGEALDNPDLIPDIVGETYDVEIPVSSVSASAYSDPYIPEYTIDSDLTNESRWSAEGSTDTWLQLDLGELRTVNTLDIAFFNATERDSCFNIQTSLDGSEWTTQRSNIISNQETSFSFAETEARYIRYEALGNSEEGSDWNSVIEIDVFLNTLDDSVNISNGANVDTCYEEADPVVIDEDGVGVVTGEFVTGSGATFIEGNPDSSKDPGENFDMSIWKITYPNATETDPPEVSENEFYTDPNTGAMVFETVNKGEVTSSSTKYSRTELREMVDVSRESGTKSLGNNWVISTASDDTIAEAGAVNGNMKATVAVDAVSTTNDDGSEFMLGRVIVGQIHASDNEPFKIFYRKLPGNTNGSVYFNYEDSNEEVYFEFYGDRGNTASDPADGIPLGEKWAYEVDVNGREMTVTVIRENGDFKSQTITWDNQYDNDWFYFKAGNYNQNNGGVDGDYAQVSFYHLDVTHGETDSEEPVVEEPVIEEPIVEEPVIEDPVVEEPIVVEPVYDVELPVQNVSSSASLDTYTPESATDNNSDPESRWSAEGTSDTWLQLDLGELTRVNTLEIDFFNASERNSCFNIQTSLDGVSWTTQRSNIVSNGETSFSFNETETRYVRYEGLGNSESDWNSIIEIDVLLNTLDDSVDISNGPSFESCPAPAASAEEPDTATFDGVPYDYERYQDALDKANLQQSDYPGVAGSSKTDVVSAGGYEGYESDYFYIDDNSGNLTFEMNGDSNRNELRFAQNFITDLSDTQYVLSADLLPINPSESVKDSTDGEEITLLQVHNKGTTGATDNTVLSHPLLRVVWDGESRTDDATNSSYSNGYWAIIKTNAYECSNDDGDNYNANCPDSYSSYYLGSFVEGKYVNFDVIVGNSKLIINVDGDEQVNYNIDYWEDLYSYFKAGVYNQFTDGNSVVQFASLTFEEESVDSDDGQTVEPTEPSEETEASVGQVQGETSDGFIYGTGASFAIANLDASKDPGDNFDMSIWKITYPDATETDPPEVRDDEFYTDPNTGAMVFETINQGEKTSSSTKYSRTELREMVDVSRDSGTKSLGNNWVISEASSDIRAEAGGINGNMKATVAVDRVSTSNDEGSDFMLGRVIVGQIHASNDEPFKIFYRKLPGNSKGSVYFNYEDSDVENYYEFYGSRDNDASNPEDGIELGEKWSYEVDVQGRDMTVTVIRENGDFMSKTITWDDQFDDDWFYFKAGNYNQNNGGEDGDYAKVSIFHLDVSHD